MISETWTYASANSVTYAGDLTGIYSPGMRVRLTQGAIKYFVIVSVVYSSPNTTITFYGGALFTLTNDPITSHDATAAAIPQGFPTALLRTNTVIDGFCPVLPNLTTKFLRGDGGWETPAGAVTNGDSHDHNGGDGGQIDHGGLAGLADDDHGQYIKHSLATAANDMLMASGAGAFVKKTLAEVKTALGLGSAAYTASGDYATSAKGVTNGDSHDHNGGDGGQIDHGGLAGLADDDHGQYLLRTEYAGGWIAAPALTFNAADAPTYTVNCSGDYSAIIMPGMRMKMTQGAAIKYFIVTKVSFSSPNTTITLYGGTDYTLGSTITLPYYSMLKAPAGFPMSPNKWSTKLTDTTQRSQASPTDSTWYNLGSLSMVVPIGSWYLSLKIYAASNTANTPGYHVIYIALSTSTSSVTNSTLWTQAVVLNPTTISWEVEIKDVVDLTAKTSYYPIMERLSDGSGGHIYFYNDINAMVITALCAYL